VSAVAEHRAPVGAIVAAGRRSRNRRWWTLIALLLLLLVALSLVTLCVGERTYGPGEVFRVILGDQVPGASFTVGRLRLPRLLTGILAGLSFGIGGVIFQTMLRNALASPDIVGVTSGASAAAVLGITIWGMSGVGVSLLAVSAGLAVAMLIYALSCRNGVSGARLAASRAISLR